MELGGGGSLWECGSEAVSGRARMKAKLSERQ